jgi:hypothetical protein
MPTTDSRIDVYIRKAQPFAHDILREIRDIVHDACPDAEETMKWSFPHFDYKGVFCSMAAFKAHATFGFWKQQLLSERLAPGDRRALAGLDRIVSRDALPSRKTLVRIVKAAARMNDEGLKVVRPDRPARRAPRPPADLTAALAGNTRASATFKRFSPSQKREYVEWIVGAKQAATREKRVATAVEWLAEGKPRHWKYVR